MNKNDSLEEKVEQALGFVRNQRQQIARLRDQVQRLERVLEACLGDPLATWLFRCREERMDPTVPIYDPQRAEFHWARYRFAAQYVENQVVVDAACGTGYGSHHLSEQGNAVRVLGFDLSPEAIDYAEKKHAGPRITYQTADARALPLADESVDVVVSFETLEHVVDGERLIAEFARILKPEGRLIVSTPNAWPLTVAPFHVREYDRQSFLDVLVPHCADVQLWNQNSGSDYEFNRGQPAGIVLTDDANHQVAECFLAVCKKAGR